MKVLLATDGTRYGDAAVDMIGQLRLGEDDEVQVLCVVDMAVPFSVDVYGGYVPDTPEIEKNARDNAQNVAQAAVERLQGSVPGVRLSCDVLFGSPESRIVETAEEWNADLIVMGSHGYNAWERLLLGSVSDSVAHHAPCSVLIVRAPADA